MTSSYCSSTRESANLIVYLFVMLIFHHSTSSQGINECQGLQTPLLNISIRFRLLTNVSSRNTYVETYVSINDIYDIIDRVFR